MMYKIMKILKQVGQLLSCLEINRKNPSIYLVLARRSSWMTYDLT